MRLTRLNWVLLALVLVLGLVLGLERSPESVGSVDDPAFPSLDPAEILRAEVRDLGNDAAAPLVLTRASREAPWRVEARSQFPAEAYPLEALMAALGNLRGRDQVAEDPKSLGLFGLAEGMGTGLELSRPGGVPWRFVLGLPGGQAGGFVRSASDSRVFSLPAYTGLSTAPRQWVEPRLFDFDASRVARVEIALAGAELVFERDDKGIWREADTQLVAPRVTLEDLVGDLDAMVLFDLAPRGTTAEEAGIGEALPRVRLLDGAGEPVADLAIGSVSPQGPRYVRLASWTQAGHPEWVGLVAAPLAESVMKRVSTVIEALGQG